MPGHGASKACELSSPSPHCWKSLALAVSCAHRLSPSFFSLLTLWLLLRPLGKGEIFAVSVPHLPEHQSHQVWIETVSQSTRAWVGQAMAILVNGLLLQELCYLWFQSVWLWARHLVPVGRTRKRSQAKAPSGRTI